jgi:hypothetical protein
MDPVDAKLERFWTELQTDARVAELGALLGALLGNVPGDRKLSLFELLPLAPAVMAHLSKPGDQWQTLGAVAHAYARAAGLHFLED